MKLKFLKDYTLGADEEIPKGAVRDVAGEGAVNLVWKEIADPVDEEGNIDVDKKEEVFEEYPHIPDEPEIEVRFLQPVEDYEKGEVATVDKNKAEHFVWRKVAEPAEAEEKGDVSNTSPSKAHIPELKPEEGTEEEIPKIEIVEKEGTVDISKHYKNERVKQVILDWCSINEPKKAGRSLIAGHSGWYRYDNGEKALVPATESGYSRQIKRMKRQGVRSLYHSLNYFDPSVFDEWVPKNEDKSPGGYEDTIFYGLGTDIDLEDEEKVEGLDRDRTVTEAEDRKWLEKAVKFHIDWLRDQGISKKIIKPYFSGNGAYVSLDPSVVFLDCEPQKAEIICRAYNYVIKQIEGEFFEKYPEARDYVQFDALNNAKRQWKTPLSIHKSKPFACIPLDVDDPKIDLDEARPPLSDEMLAAAEERIRKTPLDERGKHTKKLGELIQKPILEEGKTPRDEARNEIYDDAGLHRDAEPISVDIGLDDEEAIPPCIAKLLDGHEALSHARGKALLALFLNKTGLEPEEAKQKWTQLCNQAGGPKTNIFESFYNDDLNLPRCKTIQKTGSCFPHMNFGDISICDPDETCREVHSLTDFLRQWFIEAEIIPSQISADLVGSRVRVRGRVVAEKGKKAIPKKISAFCEKCGASCEEEFKACGSEVERLIFKGRRQTYKVLKEIGKRFLPPGKYKAKDGEERECSHPKSDVLVKTSDHLDYSVLWIEDNLEDMEEFRGNRASSLAVHVVGPEIPNSNKIVLEGELRTNPSSMDIVMLADSIEPEESIPSNLELSEETLHYFTNDWADTNPPLNQIAPDMVGRDLVREARLLTLHSPMVIPDVDGDTFIRGCIRECLFGDSKTYKSKSVKDLTTEHYLLGDYCTAESGSRAGLIYSVDTDKKALRWGTLPLNDQGWVGIDGLNNLHSSEMMEFREVLENMRVIVRKFVSGEALARVRITGCMNPPKSMDQYLTPCEAIKDTYIFKRTPDITRWDIFIPFNDDDVSKKKIADREPKERPVPDDMFKKSVHWAWGRRPEHIHYSEEATRKIKEKAPELIEEYGVPTLPIVHNGIRDVITRLSVAYACLGHSTGDHVNVDVEQNHVKKTVDFYERMLEELKVDEYKEMLREELTLSQEDFIDIAKEIDARHVEILDALKLGPRSSTELAEELKVSTRTVKERYGLLKNYSLIETKPGEGVTLTPKGVRFIKKLLGLGGEDSTSQNISETVKQTFTKSKVERSQIEEFHQNYLDFDGDTESGFINEQMARYDIDEETATRILEGVKERHDDVEFSQHEIEELGEASSGEVKNHE